MEPQVFPFFSALKRNIRKNSVMVSSRSPGCSTAIESLIPALAARVLQSYTQSCLYIREGVFTTVTRKICNYCLMNNIDRPGRTNYSATGISLGEM